MRAMIEEMARASGIADRADLATLDDIQALERFAHLVAERCIEIGLKTWESCDVGDAIREAFPAPTILDWGVACACTGACRETGICPLHGGRMGPSREERESIRNSVLEEPEVREALHWWRTIKAKRDGVRGQLPPESAV